MIEDTLKKTKPKPKKITKSRLKNIGLYYLERFESSTKNLKEVLKRRVDKYAYQNPEFNKNEAYGFIDEIVCEFENSGYVSDARFAELKVRDYLSAGKSARYIKTKLKSKGIDESSVDALIDAQDYDPKSAALKLAQKKHIGPFRTNEDDRKLNMKKDLGILLRAGFDYDTITDILATTFENGE